MSNITQTGEASSVKLKVEDYIKQANQNTGKSQSSITQVDIDAMINSKLDVS